MKDIEKVLKETYLNNNKICNYLKEIFVVCRMCLWNYNKYFLVISPCDQVINLILLLFLKNID